VESIDSILEGKRKRFDELRMALHILRGINFEVSYSAGLSREEQIKYAEIGLYRLGNDVDGKSMVYRT